MKKLEMNQMETIEGGLTNGQRAGCAAYGLAAGIASGFNPLVGGLTTLGCMLMAA